MYKTNKFIIKEIYSSNIKIISEKAKTNIANHVHKVLDFQRCYNDILFVENANAAAEIVTFIVNHFIQKEDLTATRNNIKNIMTKLFDSYKYHEYSKNTLLENYDIRRNNTTHLKYKIADKTEIYKINNSNKHTNVDTSSKIIAHVTAIFAATMNNNLAIAEELTKYLLQNANKFLDKLRNAGGTQHKDCTEAIAAVIVMFIKPEFQIEIIIDLKKYWDNNFNILSNFSKILVDNDYYIKTVELLTEPALPNSNKPEINLTNCYSNLALAYYKLGNYIESEKYYLRAFENYKEEDVICNLISIYTHQGEMDKANEFMWKLPTGYLKNLLLMRLNPSLVTDEQLKLIHPEKLSPYCKEVYEALKYIAYINNYNYIVDIKIKNGFINFLNDCSDYMNAFTLAVYAKEYETAHIIFNKIPLENINNSKTLKHYDLLFHTSYYFKKIIEFIKEFNCSDKEAVDILNTSSTCLLADEKTTEAAENIQKALEYNPYNEETLEIGITTALLNNDKAIAKEYSNKLSQEKQEEIITSYSSDDKLAKNIEQLVECYDSKKIHNYYQLKKKQALYETSQKIIKNDINLWCTNKGIIKSTDTIFVGKYKGFDCYAKIAKNLQLNNKINICENALKKGILHHSTGGTGVKFIKNNAVELKISEGERLFTNIIHTNDNGKLFIYFDHNGNHNEADRFFRDHHLEYVSNNYVEFSGHHSELYFE